MCSSAAGRDAPVLRDLGCLGLGSEIVLGRAWDGTGSAPKQAVRQRAQSRETCCWPHDHRCRTCCAAQRRGQFLHDYENSTSLSMPIFHRGTCLAIDLALANGLTLVVRLLALRETDRELDAAALVVEAKRHECHAALHGPANQLADLLAMQEQLAAPRRLMVGVPAIGVRADVHVVDPDLAGLDAGVAVAEVHAAVADRLHLGAL